MIELDVINKISNVNRFSGNFLFNRENVSSHSLEMILLCINFSELVVESDKKELCYRAAIHDLEESISSDVPRPLKYNNPELKKLIDSTAMKLLSSYVDNRTLNDVVTAKDSNDINGFLVGLADRIQCYLKISSEVKYFGNNSLKKDLDNFNDALPDIFKSIEDTKVMSADSKKKLKDYLNILVNFY